MSQDGTFRAGRLEVGPGLTLDGFEHSDAARHTGADAGGVARASMNYYPGGVLATIDGCEILGRRAVVGLTFRDGRLERASIFVRLPGDGTDWSQWTLDQELARKREHELLATMLFGAVLVPKAFEINGKKILPLELTPEHPLHAVFAWGEVVSGYDSKGGMAEMWIRYGGGVG